MQVAFGLSTKSKKKKMCECSSWHNLPPVCIRSHFDELLTEIVIEIRVKVEFLQNVFFVKIYKVSQPYLQHDGPSSGSLTIVTSQHTEVGIDPRSVKKQSVVLSRCQKQSPGGVLSKRFVKSTGKHLCSSIFFNKVADLSKIVWNF